MTIPPVAGTAISNSSTTDFAALILENKNYKRADVARIDPRDAYKRKNSNNSNTNEGGTGARFSNAKTATDINARLEKIVFKIDLSNWYLKI